MKAILFDLDGVFYVGDKVIPGAADCLEWVQREEIPHLFLTNTSSRPRSAIVQKLAAMGISVGEEEILTPPVVAVAWAKAHRLQRLALFVPAATRAEFGAIPLLDEGVESGADAVVVGDLGEGWDFLTLNCAFRLLMESPRPILIALGMTRYWRATDGLRLDAAPYIMALSHAAGVEPLVLGKPSAEFFHTAIERLGVEPADTLMVGDDIRGDIGGAQEAGMHGLLVRTGKYRPADLEREIRPFGVIASVAELPVWWTDQTVRR